MVKAAFQRAVSVLLIGLSISIASPKATRADEPRDPTKDAAAKELFLRGIVLLHAGDPERAVDYFRRSRALVETATNTTNLAICLEALDRHDEALEMYEELMARHAAELGPDERADVTKMIAFLRKQVASVDVSANVDGVVTIDGRSRGRLPFSAPLRVLPGRHRLRVERIGYRLYDASFEAPLNGQVTVNARLEVVAGSGVVRVEDSALEGGGVFVDGARVGAVPWEGVLPVGRHVLWTRLGARGSAPNEIVVVEGQTSLATPASRDLGGIVNLVVDPASAEIAIDGVGVARGRWDGRLPRGDHDVSASEAGYVTQSHHTTVTDAATHQVMLLEVDRSDPRWAKVASGRFVLGAFGAPALASTIDAYPHGHDGNYVGVLAGARLGYRLRLGFAPEVSAGFAEMRSHSSRSLSDAFTPPGDATVTIKYGIHDDDWLRGPFGSIGASLTRPIWRIDLASRVALGALGARASDTVSVRAFGFRKFLRTTVRDKNRVVNFVAPFVLAELGVVVPAGPLELGGAMAVAWFPASGPGLGHTQIDVPPNRCSGSMPGGVGCAPSSDVLAQDRASGPFVLALPQVSASYTF